jgi:Ca2+-binding EF-hand superfamily protein
VKKNPFYYHALKNLNTLENNKYGITIDDWIKGIKKVIMEYNTEGFDSNWDEVYHLIAEEGKNKTITQDTLLRLIRKLGYEISEDAVKNIVEEIGELDQNKFKEIILDVEMNSSKRNI